jgi:hypothetical protein
MLRLLFQTFFLFILAITPARAEDKIPVCANAADRACLMRQVEALTPGIEKQEWQDQTLRELAKTYAYDGQTDKAIALIEKIGNSDTKAMTIRGIGMAAASLKWEPMRYRALFARLAEEAEKISHAPSKGIAYTYIAMAQAYAGENDGAHQTAMRMDNAALRNKAFAETAEIQAARGDLAATMKSLSAMDSSSFRNKAYDTVSKIFLDGNFTEESYDAAMNIDNAYLKSKALQRILNKGNAEEEGAEPPADMDKGLALD